MIFNLSAQNSIANQFLSELRDKNIQSDRSRFRENMRRLGQLMAYEISKKLAFNDKLIDTPLGQSLAQVPVRQPVLLTVMRAGIPYFDGFLDYFNRSECGFVGAYREEGSKEIVIQLEYVATPDIEGEDVIIIDPMLATGKSFIRALQAILKRGTPAHVYIAALVAAPEGIEYVRENLNVPFSIYTCAVDEKLNHEFYIVPGLGDAGDLSYGVKL
jgi:uracil phosphoribosyltransferase